MDAGLLIAWRRGGLASERMGESLRRFPSPDLQRPCRVALHVDLRRDSRDPAGAGPAVPARIAYLEAEARRWNVKASAFLGPVRARLPQNNHCHRAAVRLRLRRR